ncbi:hypothetical protein Vretimale_16375 [Volvox reticuliferus]|uniref:Gamma-tubulin complex component n=1 Tax=Volvox reticuliferus TaxID=1737510 RepID=A0A8J4GSS0_9CHLO|nr:hypothetical protein Vretifemale_17861 [Volvox reticuliferus]GIM13195.1 hypothetical protein Vretimale_16375 [Volvox reticuliferus]
MAAQVDVAGLLSRLVAALLESSGVPENEIPQRQVPLLKMMAGILGSNAYPRGGLEGGGDDTALLHTLRKELEAAGADKSKLDKLTELCNRLSPGGGRPGLAPRLRTSLLVLLRQLHREGRQMSGGGTSGQIAPTFSLSQAVLLGGLPATYAPPSTLLSFQQQQQGQQQQQQRNFPARPASVASYAGSMPGTGLLRPTSVVTPSEMGDEPTVLSTEGSRTSLMGMQGGGGGGEGELLTRSSSLAAMPGGGPSGDPLMTGVGLNMSATTEPSLVRDVLYAAQGVRGRVVGWVPGPPGGGVARDLVSGFRPDSATSLGLGPGRAMLLDRLTELGWLFRRVREHISSCTGPGQATVRQALGAALAAEVGDYYRLLALLEAQAALPLPTPGDNIDGSNCGGPGASASGGNGQFLTLRRLVCWLSEPLRRMRLLAAIGDAAEGLEGGALAGAVYEFSRHGDPFVAANAAKLLQQVCVPLHGIIRRWVLEGVLDDPYNEFFVVQHAAAAVVSAALAAAGAAPGSLGVGAAVPPPLDLWRQTYGLDESRLPPFIGPSLAQRILRAGKAIHYLNLACGDGGWVQQRAEAWAREPPAATSATAAGGSGKLAELEGLVSAAVRSVDERLMTVIWRHHRLRAHFAAIRRFLLLGQGDWVTAFMDLAQRELDKPASDVSEVQLNSCLRQALTATNVLGGGAGGGLAAVASRGAVAAAGLVATAGYGLTTADLSIGTGGSGGEYEVDDDAAAMGLLAERLRVRREKAAGAGETGWDVFSLYYNPAAGLPANVVTGAAASTSIAATSGGPLSALFTNSAMQSYNRLARLLWRLKRAEHALSSTWGAAACGLQRMVDKMGADGYLAQPVLAMLLRLRSEMSHFATNLQYYIQFEVMEASWQEFYSRAAACTDLDSLIAAHEVHLATLLRKAFLANDGSASGGGAGNAEGTPGAAAVAEGSGPGGAAGSPSVAALRRALQDAVANMVSLRAVASRLEELVAGGARLLAARASQAKARLARGGWGTTSVSAAGGGGLPGVGAVEPPIPPAALADLRQTLAELGAQHQRAVAEFTENLPEEAHDDVRFLLARLDFSVKGVQTSGSLGSALVMQ